MVTFSSHFHLINHTWSEPVRLTAPLDDQNNLSAYLQSWIRVDTEGQGRTFALSLSLLVWPCSFLGSKLKCSTDFKVAQGICCHSDVSHLRAHFSQGLSVQNTLDENYMCHWKYFSPHPPLLTLPLLLHNSRALPLTWALTCCRVHVIHLHSGCQWICLMKPSKRLHTLPFNLFLILIISRLTTRLNCSTNTQ